MGTAFWRTLISTMKINGPPGTDAHSVKVTHCLPFEGVVPDTYAKAKAKAKAMNRKPANINWKLVAGVQIT